MRECCVRAVRGGSSSAAVAGVGRLFSDWSALVARSSWRDYGADSVGMSTGMSGRTNKVFGMKLSCGSGHEIGCNDHLTALGEGLIDAGRTAGAHGLRTRRVPVRAAISSGLRARAGSAGRGEGRAALGLPRERSGRSLPADAGAAWGPCLMPLTQSPSVVVRSSWREVCLAAPAMVSVADMVLATLALAAGAPDDLQPLKASSCILPTTVGMLGGGELDHCAQGVDGPPVAAPDAPCDHGVHLPHGHPCRSRGDNRWRT